MINLDFKGVCKWTLSANEIRQYCECPRKRYYASRDCLAIRTNVKNKNLEVGRAVHLALAYYYTELNKLVGSRLVEFDEAKELLSQIAPFVLNEEDAKLDLGDKQIYDCIVENYMETIVTDICQFEIIGCEVPFSLNNYPIEDVRYHGNIDMVVRDKWTNKIFFFEHKTCKDFRPMVYDRFDIQLHIYADYGRQTYGSDFGGMILNQVKKAKTIRGYDTDRRYYAYGDVEMADFFNWLTAKTMGAVGIGNMHEPCNNYMTCKLCEYAPICMKYGYEIPKTTDEIINDSNLVMVDDNGENKPMYAYDPREEQESDE